MIAELKQGCSHHHRENKKVTRPKRPQTKPYFIVHYPLKHGRKPFHEEPLLRDEAKALCQANAANGVYCWMTRVKEPKEAEST